METITPQGPMSLLARLTPRARRAIAVVAGVIILLIVLLLIPGVRDRIATWWLALSAPEAVREFTLIEGYSRHVGGTLARIEGTGISREEAENTLVMDYEKRGDAEFAITRSLSPSSVNVVALMPEARTYVSDENLKSGLSISMDGKWALYAVLPNSLVDGDVAYFSDPSMWRVVLLDLTTGEERQIAMGASPAFLDPEDPTQVLYMSESGLVVHDTATGASTPTNIPAGTENTPFILSDDGKYLALYSTLLNEYALFEVYSTDPTFAIRPLRDLGAAYRHIAFSGSTLYGLRQVAGGKMEVVSHDLASPVAKLASVVTFPGSMSLIGFETN